MAHVEVKPATHDEIVAIAGPLDDEVVADIIATGATAAEVMEAWTWLGADEALGPDPGHRLAGRVAEVYDILAAPQFEDDEERSTP